MLVFGTQIHIVTFLFIILETGMLVLQFFYYLFRPADRGRLLYLILLILLIFYNVTGGLFPDRHIHLSLAYQNMIAYGSGFLMAAYFPFYFYRAFDFRSLRWHALYGVPLLLMLPYLVFFVIVYAANDNLLMDIRYGVITPFIYSLVLLWAILRAIYRRYKEKSDRASLVEQVALYCAVSPWAAMTVFAWFQVGQLTEVLCTNTGFIVLSVLFIYKSVKRARKEYLYLQDMESAGKDSVYRMADADGRFLNKCREYGLSVREIEVVNLIRKGLTYKEVAGRLFISEKTVDAHMQKIYSKVGERNKIALLNRL